MYITQTINPQTFRSMNLTVDEDGFLMDQTQWSSEVAQQIATLAGVGHLSELHWQVIDLVRGRYFSLGVVPSMRDLCRELGARKFVVKNQFGSCRNMWQIAGLPHPGEEMLAYME